MSNTICRIKPRSLTLAFFNARGLKRQRDEIHQFLVDHQVDILLVQETFLTPSIRDPKVSNYNIIRNDRTRSQRGGTLIYYRRSLHCVPMDPPPNLTDIEVSVCRLAMTGHQPITIISGYLSSSNDINVTRSDFESLFDLGGAVILAGDLNCKHTSWNCTVSNRKGLALEALIDTLNFDVIAPMTETHFPDTPGHTADILDVALLKNINLRLCAIEVIHELQSDHRPVLLQLGPQADLPPPTKTIVDWVKLEETLKSTSSPHLDVIPDVISTKSEINLAIHALTRHTQTSYEQCSRQVPAMPDHRWHLPSDARALLTAMHAATRAYDTYPTEDYRKRLRYLQRAVKRRMAELRSNQWDGTLKELTPHHQAYWRLEKALKSDGTSSSMPPLVRPNLPPAFLDEEKAECLADSLEAQCSPSTLPVDPDHQHMVESEVERKLAQPPTDPLPPVTVAEVQDIIKGLPRRKAPGSDGISNRTLKCFSLNLICLMVSIFNAAMTHCVFPNTWKEADVIGIRKPGKHASQPTSYRPISLLKIFGKIYERLLLKRLKDHLESRGILIPEQFGFRARHSCPQQVLRITEHIHHNFRLHRRSTPTGAIFLDVAKAFDKVWHSGLIYKLYELHMPDRLVLIIREYLRDRSFRYRVEGTHSRPHLIRAGVPQGSVLAPTLFSIYVNDIPRTPHVQLALYADDTALYTTARQPQVILDRLQSAIDTLGDWFRKWRIEVNPEKSAAMYFSLAPNSRASALPSIKLFDRRIPWEKTVKYLGVTLDPRLSFGPHIKIVRDRAAFVLGRLHSLIRKSSKMSLRNKVTLYKTCIRPIMTYASPVFAHAAMTHLRKLQVLQNRFMRRATGAPWFVRNENLHIDLELPTIAQYMKLASQRFFETASAHTNPLIRNAANYDTRLYDARNARRSRLIRRPRHVLDDPDDAITMAIAAHPPRTHTRSQTTRRPRRRGRPSFPTSGAYTRYRHVPGRFSPSRSLNSDGLSRGPCPMGAPRPITDRQL
jgi:hypothetical protein